MKKVAVFGNAGGGKSTLSKRLSQITGLPLHILDKIQFRSGGAEVPPEEYKQIHQQILVSDRWIIDGFGCEVNLFDPESRSCYLQINPFGKIPTLVTYSTGDRLMR
jgi:hypothetical protein